MYNTYRNIKLHNKYSLQACLQPCSLPILPILIFYKQKISTDVSNHILIISYSFLSDNSLLINILKKKKRISLSSLIMNVNSN